MLRDGSTMARVYNYFTYYLLVGVLTHQFKVMNYSGR